MPNGRIHPTDSLRGVAFARMVEEVFQDDLARNARATASSIRGNGRKYRLAKLEESCFRRILKYSQ